jgi:hypothetical protein
LGKSQHVRARGDEDYHHISVRVRNITNVKKAAEGDTTANSDPAGVRVSAFTASTISVGFDQLEADPITTHK